MLGTSKRIDAYRMCKFRQLAGIFAAAAAGARQRAARMPKMPAFRLSRETIPALSYRGRGRFAGADTTHLEYRLDLYGAS